jgi:hypothetical protein
VFHKGVKFLLFDLVLGSSFTEKELVLQPNKQQLNLLSHPAAPAAEFVLKRANGKWKSAEKQRHTYDSS